MSRRDSPKQCDDHGEDFVIATAEGAVYMCGCIWDGAWHEGEVVAMNGDVLDRVGRPAQRPDRGGT